VNSEVGSIYVLVNNAGVVFGQRIMDASPAHIRRTFDVNLLSNFWTVKAILPGMKAQGGHIVTVSSVCGFAGFHSLSDYCASKWGSFAFSESLRQEIQSDPKCTKIHSTVICPYFIQVLFFDCVGFI
jgi:NADP-dependent 3-hydroxy acid dehydrogenase YdfG